MRGLGRGLRRLRRDQRGQAVVLVGLFLILLCAAAGLAVSIGTSYAASARLQNAVDAGALAAAEAMAAGQSSTQQAAALVSTNDSNASDVSVAESSSTQVATVSAQESVPGGFATLFGVPVFTVSAHASAASGIPAAYSYTLFQGSTDASQTLQVNGSTTIDGSVHSNDNYYSYCGSVVTGTGTASDTYTTSQPSYAACAPCDEGCSSDVPTIPTPSITADQILALPDVTVLGSPDDLVACKLSEYTSTTNKLVCDPASGSKTTTFLTNGAALNYVVWGTMYLGGGTSWNGLMATINGTLTVAGGVPVSGGDEGLTLAAVYSNASSGGTSSPAIAIGGTSVLSGGLIYDPVGAITFNGSTTVDATVIGLTVAVGGSGDVFNTPTQEIGVGISTASLVPTS